MDQKHQRVSGRTRGTPRPGRKAQTAEARMAAARQVAHRFVMARWPELGAVTPVATRQRGHTPSPELLARLGLRADEIARPEGEGEYTFTFCGEQRANDATTPMVANVTVDAHLRIIKTSVSR